MTYTLKEERFGTIIAVSNNENYILSLFNVLKTSENWTFNIISQRNT